MTIEVALVISILSVSFSVFFGITNTKRNSTRDIEAKAKWNALIETKIDACIAVAEDSRNQMKELRNEIKGEIRATNEKLVLVERKADKANERIDELIKGQK